MKHQKRYPKQDGFFAVSEGKALLDLVQVALAEIVPFQLLNVIPHYRSRRSEPTVIVINQLLLDDPKTAQEYFSDSLTLQPQPQVKQLLEVTLEIVVSRHPAHQLRSRSLRVYCLSLVLEYAFEGLSFQLKEV